MLECMAQRHDFELRSESIDFDKLRSPLDITAAIIFLLSWLAVSCDSVNSFICLTYCVIYCAVRPSEDYETRACMGNN